eukprot:tig00021680_g23054.t1
MEFRLPPDPFGPPGQPPAPARPSELPAPTWRPPAPPPLRAAPQVHGLNMPSLAASFSAPRTTSVAVAVSIASGAAGPEHLARETRPVGPSVGNKAVPLVAQSSVHGAPAPGAPAPSLAPLAKRAKSDDKGAKSVAFRCDWMGFPAAVTLMISCIVDIGLELRLKDTARNTVETDHVTQAFNKFLAQGVLRDNIRPFVLDLQGLDMSAGRTKFLRRWQKVVKYYRIYNEAEKSGKKLTDADFPLNFQLTPQDYMKVKPYLDGAPEENPHYSMESDGDRDLHPVPASWLPSSQLQEEGSSSSSSPAKPGRPPRPGEGIAKSQINKRNPTQLSRSNELRERAAEERAAEARERAKFRRFLMEQAKKKEGLDKRPREPGPDSDQEGTLS